MQASATNMQSRRQQQSTDSRALAACRGGALDTSKQLPAPPQAGNYTWPSSVIRWESWGPQPLSRRAPKHRAHALGHRAPACKPRASPQVPRPQPQRLHHPVDFEPVDLLPVVPDYAACVAAVLIVRPPIPAIDRHRVVCCSSVLCMTPAGSSGAGL